MIRCVKVDPLAYAAAEPQKHWDAFVEKAYGEADRFAEKERTKENLFHC